MKRYQIVFPILLLLCLTGCTDGLKKVSKAMLIYGTTLQETQKNVIAGQQQGFYSEASARKVLDVCDRANVAGQQVQAIIKSISALDPASRASIIALLTPVSEALDPYKIEIILAIKDPATKQKVEGGFILMRSTISSIMVIAQTSKG